MNVSLTPELEAFVHEKVASGRYTSASEVVRESLRLLEEREWIRQRRVEELRAEIKKGIDDLEAGRVIELNNDDELREFFEDVKRRGLERLNSRTAKQK